MTTTRDGHGRRIPETVQTAGLGKPPVSASAREVRMTVVETCQSSLSQTSAAGVASSAIFVDKWLEEVNMVLLTIAKPPSTTWLYHKRGLPWNQAQARANKEWQNSVSVHSSVPPERRRRRSLSLHSVVPGPSVPPRRPAEPLEPPRWRREQSEISRRHEKDKEKKRHRRSSKKSSKDRRRRNKSRSESKVKTTAKTHKDIVAPRYQKENKQQKGTDDKDRSAKASASARGRSAPLTASQVKGSCRPGKGRLSRKKKNPRRTTRM